MLIIYIFPLLPFSLLLFNICLNLKLRNHSRELVRISVMLLLFSYTKHAPSSSASFINTVYTTGVTSHKLFSLGHDSQTVPLKGSTYRAFSRTFLSFFYLVIFVLGRIARVRSSVRAAVSPRHKNSTRKKAHKIIPRLSASESSFTIDHQCARAADGQCAESSRSSPL